MDIQSLDLDALESSANDYFISKLGSKAQDTPIPRTVMNGVLSVLEAISSGQSKALFKEALDNNLLCLAALICEPPILGLSIPLRQPGTLIEEYDRKHAGRGFRNVCVALARFNFPLECGSILAKELVAEGLNYKPTTLVRNGISEISGAMARARLRDENLMGEQHFVQQIFRQGDAAKGTGFVDLASLMRIEMYSYHLNEGSFLDTNKFLMFMDQVSPLERESSVKAFAESASRAMIDTNLSNVLSLANLLLTTNDPVLDIYREAVVQQLDPELNLSQFLKASFKMIDLMPKKSFEDMDKISDVYMHAGYEFLTSAIRDREDYVSLTQIPNVDMSQIDMKKLPVQARGARLEIDLGM